MRSLLCTTLVFTPLFVFGAGILVVAAAIGGMPGQHDEVGWQGAPPTDAERLMAERATVAVQFPVGGLERAGPWGFFGGLFANGVSWSAGLWLSGRAVFGAVAKILKITK